MNNVNIWWIFFIVLLFVFSIVMYLVRNKKLYFMYFLFGFLFGFYFDYVSVVQNYYTYYQYFPSILGVPLSVTIAEGFAVVITIFLAKFIKRCVEEKKFSFKLLY